MDDQIGALRKEIEQQVGTNVLMIITSDHGEAFGGHGLIDHRNSLYRELIHVPLIFWWPGHLPAGVRIERPISLASVPATLMSLVGASETDTFPGPSLAEIWNGTTRQEDWPYPLAELAHIPFESPQNPCRYGEIKSLVGPELQYIVHEKFGEELYKWKQDPGEVQNLAKTPEAASITRDFALRLHNQLNQSPRSTRLGMLCSERSR